MNERDEYGVFAKEGAWSLINDWLHECGSTERFTPHKSNLSGYEVLTIAKACVYYDIDIDDFVNFGEL